MQQTQNNNRSGLSLNIIDALLYLLAGSSMTIISISFLLWLRF